ncbi:hypothetical protein ACU4GD_38660 [Cupriavidus basilensis]
MRLDNDVTLDFMDAQGDVALQHYAFLISDAEFEQSLARIRARNLMYWSDLIPPPPRRGQHGRWLPQRIYFEDPSMHLLEIFTKR